MDPEIKQMERKQQKKITDKLYYEKRYANDEEYRELRRKRALERYYHLKQLREAANIPSRPAGRPRKF